MSPTLAALDDAPLCETVAVDLAEGSVRRRKFVNKALVTMRSVPPHDTTSMGNELIRGNRIEVPWFAGTVVELGRCQGHPDVNGFIYAALKPSCKRSSKPGPKSGPHSRAPHRRQFASGVES